MTDTWLFPPRGIDKTEPIDFGRFARETVAAYKRLPEWKRRDFEKARGRSPRSA